MSENRLTLTLIGTAALIGFMCLSFIFFTALVLDISIGAASVALLFLIGVSIRKWQHSSLPMRAHKLEERRHEHEKSVEYERLALERMQLEANIAAQQRE